LRHTLQARFQNPSGFRTLLSQKIHSIDDLFLQKAVKIVDAKLSDESFGMPQLCQEMNMSRSNLFRKIKALTGQPVTGFIRNLRLEKAKQLLETTNMNVSEVCFHVGFNSPNYFSRVFQEAFGVAPSEVRKG